MNFISYLWNILYVQWNVENQELHRISNLHIGFLHIDFKSDLHVVDVFYQLKLGCIPFRQGRIQEVPSGVIHVLNFATNLNSKICYQPKHCLRTVWAWIIEVVAIWNGWLIEDNCHHKKFSHHFDQLLSTFERPRFWNMEANHAQN